MNEWSHGLLCAGNACCAPSRLVCGKIRGSVRLVDVPCALTGGDAWPSMDSSRNMSYQDLLDGIHKLSAAGFPRTDSEAIFQVRGKGATQREECRADGLSVRG